MGEVDARGYRRLSETVVSSSKAGRWGKNRTRRMPLTLVRINKKNSGSNFHILNLQAVTMVKCRHFENEQKREATVFFNDRALVKLVGADAERLVSALEESANYPRLASGASLQHEGRH